MPGARYYYAKERYPKNDDTAGECFHVFDTRSGRDVWVVTVKLSTGERTTAYAEGPALESGRDVRIYDDVAGHYTRCHSLTQAQIRRVRRLAHTA